VDQESRWSRLRAWWPVAAVVVAALGIIGISMQLGTAIDEVRTLRSDIVGIHQRLVALEQTTSQIRLDAIGAKARAGGDRVPRPRPITKAPADGEAKAKKAGKAKAKAKAEGADVRAAKAGKGKKGKGKAKGKAG
jgi:hypothetical protein